MKRLLTVLFVLTPAFVFAQDNGGGLDLDLKSIIQVLIAGVGVPLAVQILKYAWPKAPTWLKAIAGPVLAPALMYVASLLSTLLGVEVDFGPIIAVITGIGLASSIAFSMGKKKGVTG